MCHVPYPLKVHAPYPSFYFSSGFCGARSFFVLTPIALLFWWKSLPNPPQPHWYDSPSPAALFIWIITKTVVSHTALCNSLRFFNTFSLSSLFPIPLPKKHHKKHNPFFSPPPSYHIYQRLERTEHTYELEAILPPEGWLVILLEIKTPLFFSWVNYSLACCYIEGRIFWGKKMAGWKSRGSRR